MGKTVTLTGRLGGLGAIRAVLVAIIILFQSAEVSQSFQLVFSTALWIVPALALPALFAATGFVWVMSRESQDARAFLIARAWRSGPSLVAVIVFTALALGPLITTEGLRRYFADTDTWLYLANIVGWPRLSLPGLFEFNNLSQTVNTIVWAVPPFVLLALVIAFTPAGRSRIFFAGAAILLSVLPIIADLSGIFAIPVGQPGELLMKSVSCLVCGLSGGLAYQIRDYLPFDRRLAVGAALFLALVALAGDVSWAGLAWLPVLIAIPTTLVATHIAAEPWPGRRLAQVLQPYLLPALLMSFPLQQAVVTLGPEDQAMITNALLAVPLIMLGAFSVRQSLRLTRLAAPDSATTDHDVEPAWRKRRSRKRSFAQRLRDSVLDLVLIIILAAIVFAVLGLTYYALQRDAVGI